MPSVRIWKYLIYELHVLFHFQFLPRFLESNYRAFSPSFCPSIITSLSSSFGKAAAAYYTLRHLMAISLMPRRAKRRAKRHRLRVSIAADLHEAKFATNKQPETRRSALAPASSDARPPGPPQQSTEESRCSACVRSNCSVALRRMHEDPQWPLGALTLRMDSDALLALRSTDSVINRTGVQETAAQRRARARHGRA